jgi:hypothetical protein
MTPDAFEAVIRVALAAAQPWDFALGGGLALLAHGVVDRPTFDVDLFTADDRGVRDAASAVAEALLEEGYEVGEVEVESDLAGLIEGFDSAMVELEVVTPDGLVIPVSLGVQPRSQPAVALAVGPVIHLADLAAGKVSAMANRAEVRDFIDVAALHERFSREQLLALAADVDPGLTAEDYAAAIRQLAAYPDTLFARYGADAAAIRAAFNGWPR